MTSSENFSLWELAFDVEEEHGADGRLFIEMQQEPFLLAGDVAGVLMWEGALKRWLQFRDGYLDFVPN